MGLLRCQARILRASDRWSVPAVSRSRACRSREPQAHEAPGLVLVAVVPVAAPQPLGAGSAMLSRPRVPLAQHVEVLVQHELRIGEELRRRAAQQDAVATRRRAGAECSRAYQERSTISTSSTAVAEQLDERRAQRRRHAVGGAHQLLLRGRRRLARPAATLGARGAALARPARLAARGCRLLAAAVPCAPGAGFAAATAPRPPGTTWATAPRAAPRPA